MAAKATPKRTREGSQAKGRMRRDDPWDTAFVKPIKIPGGGELATLREAFAYIEALPKAVVGQSDWQRAIEYIDRAVNEQAAWSMFAGLAIGNALHGGELHRRPTPAVTKEERYKAARRAYLEPRKDR